MAVLANFDLPFSLGSAAFFLLYFAFLVTLVALMALVALVILVFLVILADFTAFLTTFLLDFLPVTVFVPLVATFLADYFLAFSAFPPFFLKMK